MLQLLSRWLRPDDHEFMPRTCFVSHAYKDEAAVAALKSVLPPHVIAVVFPPISIRPDQRISDDLIHSINRCRGLIYLRGGHSAGSPWVSFERDFALRTGKKVFGFDEATKLIERDRHAPGKVPAYFACSSHDKKTILYIRDWLRRKRHFDIFDPTAEELPSTSNWTERSMKEIESRLSPGGSLVVFLSKLSVRSHHVRAETAFARKHSKNILIVWLDEPREVLAEPGSDLLFPVDQAPVIIMRDRKLQWNQIDNLIVRVFHLVHENNRRKACTP